MCRRQERLYSIWRGMKDRCLNPNAANAKYYNHKGVKVCKRWRENYEHFKAWALAHGYDDTKSLDRRNTNGNYSPQNCTWVPLAEQVYNRSITRWIDGVPLKHYCKEHGISYSTVLNRIRHGATTEEAARGKGVL